VPTCLAALPRRAGAAAPKRLARASPSPSPSPRPGEGQEKPKGPTMRDVILKMFQMLCRTVMDQVMEDHAQLERQLKDHMQKLKELDRH
jgi:hypothetical protein